MRILTFLHSFEPGGVERVALRLVARWRTAGIDAPLFMGRTEGALFGEFGAGLGFSSPRQPWFGSAWCETLWMVLTLPRQIRAIRPDVLFCAGSTYTIVAVAMKLILGAECPPVVAKISNDLTRSDLPAVARWLWRRWLRIQSRFVDRWVVMEAAMLDEVAALLGRVNLSVVPDPAIDHLPAPVIPRRRSDTGIRYLSIGRLVAQKDHATMLSAFAIAARPQDHLTIVGDGPLRATLERRAARLGIRERLSFAGHVPNAAALMPEHDVLLLSSRYEGVPAVLVEALAVGMRIVVTNCGAGVHSLLDGGRLGQMVPIEDPDAFAAAMRRATDEDVEVDAARAQAGRFTLDAAAGRYLDAMHRAATTVQPANDLPLMDYAE